MTVSEYHGDQGAQCVDGAAQTLNQRLADHFRERPGQWLPARQLAAIAGFAGWRTRISNLRRPPFNMAISNRQSRGVNALGLRFVQSDCRFVGGDTASTSALMAEPTSGMITRQAGEA